MAKYKIAIDAGHASDTAGKRHPDGYREHYSNVKMAYFFNEILIANGDFETLKVAWDDTNFYDDEEVTLADRQKLINKFGAIVSFSFHANAYGDGKTYNSAKGVCTYSHNNATKAKDSMALAKLVQAELIKGTAQQNRKTPTANFAMCNCVAMGTEAAVLIESAFMTNKTESDLLKTDAFCREVAEEAAQGLFNYLEYKGNVKLGKKTFPTAEETDKKVESGKVTYSPGKQFSLTKVNFYTTAYKTTTTVVKTGKFYVWDSQVINNRIRLTNRISNVGKSNKVTGWVNLSDLVSSNTVGTVTNATTGKVASYKHDGLEYNYVFDHVYYSDHYPDLKQAYGTNATKLFNHFIKYGMKEARQAKATFNVNIYKNAYVDLQKSYGNNLVKYYQHYIKYGYKEGRKAC